MGTVDRGKGRGNVESSLWSIESIAGAGVMALKRDRRLEASPVDEDRRLGADRRRFERVLVDLEVDYRSEDTFLFAYIADISAMGIFIRTNAPEPPGTRLNLRFTPPGAARPLELEGMVIWINPYRPGDRENLNPGMGVQFVDLHPSQRNRLTDFVKTFAYLDDEDEDEDDGGDMGSFHTPTA
ncbi:MAG: TIGR02266 family protein [Deltaproteobacteria bacterium]|nr:TIGR02266 family protein [Deltaproteobacteria bacterium]